MANLFFRTNVAPYRIDTYNALHEKLGCEFYFLYDYDSSQDFNMQDLYDQCNFKPHFLKTINLKGENQKYCTDINEILRKESPEIVIVPEFKILTGQVLLYKWLHRKRFKVISMCDDSWDMLANGHEWSKIHKLMRRLLTPWLDNLLLVENRVVDWYKMNYNKGIWLPIIRDEKLEIPRYEKVLPLSKSFALKSGLVGKKILLYVGRLAPVKNLDTLLCAVSKAKENFTTVIVGSGELDAELREQASHIDKPIVFAGRYEGDEIRAWYNVGDVFILPSKMEPFAAVTNEALLAGCQCLISEVAGSACLIDRNNGALINPYDAESMARSIDEMMRNLDVRKEISYRPSKMKIIFEEIMNRVIEEIKAE